MWNLNLISFSNTRWKKEFILLEGKNRKHVYMKYRNINQCVGKSRQQGTWEFCEQNSDPKKFQQGDGSKSSYHRSSFQFLKNKRTCFLFVSTGKE